MEDFPSGITERWLKKHRLIYAGATRHPFILSIRDGSVDFSSFKRWLGQDYVFVREFTTFVASVLIKASKDSDDKNDMEFILGGLAALDDELKWFKRQASTLGVSLSDAVVHSSNYNYCRFLESLMAQEVDYAVAITALWAVEVVYQESFAHCLEEGSKTTPELQEACQRWGNKDFAQYCRTLQNIANRTLEKATSDVVAKAEVTFLRVLEYEVEFWNMSHGGTGTDDV